MTRDTKSLLDASAFLAVVFRESGANKVLDALALGARISTVNLAEVAAKLNQEHWEDAEVAYALDELGIETVPFSREIALLTGRYRNQTAHLGLGLGDRACLATARVMECPVLTADQAWLKLSLEGVDISCIR